MTVDNKGDNHRTLYSFVNSVFHRRIVHMIAEILIAAKKSRRTLTLIETLGQATTINAFHFQAQHACARW